MPKTKRNRMKQEKNNTIAQATPEDYVKALKLWRANPVKYVDSVLLKTLQVELEPRQREVLDAVFRDKKVLIPTHFSFGKSFLCALIALAIPNIYPHNCIGSTFAPTFRQVRDILWREMRRVFEAVNSKGIILNGDIVTTRYTIGTGSMVVGFSPSKSAKGKDTGNQSVSGRHDHVVFIIVDEAGGVSKQIFNQIEALQASGVIVYVICIGNPLDINGEFGQMCTTEKGEGYTMLHYTAYTAENMKANGLTSLDKIRKEAGRLRSLPKDERRKYYSDQFYKKPFPSLISPGFVMEKYIKWGESPLFFSYCIGEWAQSLDDTLVPLSRANEVMLGKIIDEDGKEVWESEKNGYCHYNGLSDITLALDCSGDGHDKNSLCVMEGNRQIMTKNFSKTWETSEIDYRGIKLKEDGPYIAKWIYDNVFLKYSDHSINFALDSTGGFGNTVFDSIMKYKLNPIFIKIRKVNFGVPAKDEMLYHDNIAEMAFTLADDINRTHENLGILLLPDEDLRNQITNRRKKTDGRNRNMLESKKDYKARAGESPDQFDALMMCNWLRHDTGIKYDKETEQALKNNTKTMSSTLKRGW